MVVVAQAKNKIYETAAAFRLLADPTRCKILLLLSKKKEGMCVYEVAEALEMTHSAVSHQLGHLERSGVLESFREGQTVCYELSQSPKARTIIRVLKTLHK